MKPNLLFAILVVWLLLSGSLLSQEAAQKPFSENEFTALVQSRLQQVDELRDIDDGQKAEIRDLFQQSIREVEAAKVLSAKIGHFESLAAKAPKELEQAKLELAILSTQPPMTAPKEADLAHIEQKISKWEADLGRWRTALDTIEADLKGRANRRVEIPKLLNAARERLVEINTELQSASPAEENSHKTFARRMLLLASRHTVEQEILGYEKELLAYDAMTKLLPLQRDLYVRRIALAEQEVGQWQKEVDRRRQHDAEQQSRQASREAGQAHSSVQALVRKNAELAEERKNLAANIADATRQLELVNQQLSGVKQQSERTKEKVKAVGETNAIGLMLRKQRETLPNTRAFRRNIAARQDIMREVQLARLQWRDARSALDDLDQQVEEFMKHLGTTRVEADPDALKPAVRDALKTQREYLDALIADYDTYFEKLGDLDGAEQKLIKQTEAFAQYIDERVLWISSATPLDMGDVKHGLDAIWWLAGPAACIELGNAIVADALRHSALWALATAVFLGLAYSRKRFRSRIREIGEKAARGNCYRFLPTLETALLTVLMSLAWPGLMWYLGWRLSASVDASELCKVVGIGLTETSRVFLALELLRHVCCEGGLGESHFGWSTAALRLLRHNIRWFGLPVLPLMVVAVAMAWQENNRWDASLGRMCFIAAVLCFSFVLHRILRPDSVVFQAMIVPRQGGWLERLRYVWYPLIMLTPAALAVLAAFGYHYTARQLVTRLILTTYVLVGGIVCRALLLRWIMVNQRKLAIEQARQRRAAAQAENVATDEAAPELPSSNVPERDLAVINTQTRRLVEYSLVVACSLAVWCAWCDVLPALGVLNRIEVWPASVSVVETVTGADGKIQTQVREQLGAITLASIGLAMIVLATTVIAAKNIPGLLEMAVLQHLPVDAGARYAASTISRYVITIVGVVICCGVLGVGWSKVQWLVAAMSLGLGFGLQEIFANFVSGLIILFERPVRVGDIVTIDGISGVVSRIRMRATTVIDWDRKELIIPNKEFITGRVLNWTLSDPVNRVVVNVGIAYGSDTELASRLLLKVAEDHPIVLDDPPPRVTFESFGDSALNFVLRCFLPNLENRITVIHELHMAVDRVFREAGIEIAFPQQDVHVRSINLPTPLLQPAANGDNTSWPPVQKVA